MSDEIVSGTTRSVLERRSVGTLLQSDGVGQADNFDVTGTERRGIVVRSREGRKRSRDSSTRQRPVPEDTSSPETRDALRRLSDSACRSSTQMVLAAEGDDPMSLSNAANDLESMLADMWELRGAREPDWGGVLNFLQGVMKSIDRGRGYELFTPDECRAIEAVICRHLGTWTNDKESVRETLRLLNEAGLDPWAPISGVQES